MFTLEKTSNYVKFHFIFVNYKANLRLSRSRAKVTAPAPAKYPGSGRLRLQNPGVLYYVVRMCPRKGEAFKDNYYAGETHAELVSTESDSAQCKLDYAQC